MIGSETFIIVAFICKESKIPLSLAAAISFSKNTNKAFLLITDASIISLAKSGVLSFRTVFPSVVKSSIFTRVAFSTQTDFSL
jgi:hypothetical protein